MSKFNPGDRVRFSGKPSPIGVISAKEACYVELDAGGSMLVLTDCLEAVVEPRFTLGQPVKAIYMLLDGQSTIKSIELLESGQIAYKLSNSSVSYYREGQLEAVENV